MLLQGALLFLVLSLFHARADQIATSTDGLTYEVEPETQTCVGQNCQFEKLRSKWEEVNYYPQEEDENYVEVPEEIEVHYEDPEMEPHYEDSYSKFCDRLKSFVKKIENMHPDFKNDKDYVLRKFIHYYFDLASQWNKCYPGSASMQLMDLLILAAENVKSEYTAIYEQRYPHEQTKCDHVEEIIAEEEVEVADHILPGYVGSVRGVPGQDFPNYTEVPLTSFSCTDKFIPGFYADLETGCQVFHVCYEHRRESFLCPVGTTFNQPILACDYWYNSNCSMSSSYYDVNIHSESSYSEVESTIGDLITNVIEGEETVVPEEPIKADEGSAYEKHEIAEIVKFFPVKAQVYDYSEPTKKPYETDVSEISSNIFENIISSGTKVASITRDTIDKIPEPEVKVSLSEPVKVKTIIPAKVVAVKTPVAAAAKLAIAVPIAKLATVKAAAAVPIVKVAADVAAVKSVLPLAAKAKIAVPIVKVAADVAAVKSALPLAKAKIAVPIVKVVANVAAAKAAMPVVAKAKLAAAVPVAHVVSTSAVKAKSIPFVKSKVATFPVMKGKLVKTAAVPLVKAKMLTLPLTKAKVASKAIPLLKYSAVKAIPVVKSKVAVLSPLTKKALALGYIKLLKAKKLKMMG